jgi:hypothetical protein
MVLRNPLLRAYITEYSTLMKIVSTHKQIKSANRQKQKEFFRSLFSRWGHLASAAKAELRVEFLRAG